MRGLSYFPLIATFVVGILLNSGSPVRAAQSGLAPPKSFAGQPHPALLPARGGAKNIKAPIKGRKSAAALAPEKSTVDSWLENLFSMERLPYLICTVLSVAYFLLYNEKSKNILGKITPKSDHYKDGFCVTGLATKVVPSTCSAVTGNSHQFAWGIDVLFTIAALVLPFTGLTKTPNSAYLIANAVVFAAVIGGHGFLHNIISSQSCNGGGNIEGYVAYIFILMLVDILGFSSIPSMQNGTLLSVILSAALTWIIYAFTNNQQSIAGFFMISQLAVSVTGLLVPNPNTVTPQLGWTFIAPCVISLIEFLNCNFLVQYGGHAWYDVFLHLSMLVSLLYGEFISPFEKVE